MSSKTKLPESNALVRYEDQQHLGRLRISLATVELAGIRTRRKELGSLMMDLKHKEETAVCEYRNRLEMLLERVDKLEAAVSGRKTVDFSDRQRSFEDQGTGFGQSPMLEQQLKTIRRLIAVSLFQNGEFSNPDIMVKANDAFNRNDLGEIFSLYCSLPCFTIESGRTSGLRKKMADVMSSELQLEFIQAMIQQEEWQVQKFLQDPLYQAYLLSDLDSYIEKQKNSLAKQVREQESRIKTLKKQTRNRRD